MHEPEAMGSGHHMAREALGNQGIRKGSKKRDSVGPIDCRRMERGMLGDTAVLLPALVVFGFHLESLNYTLIA